MNSILFVMVNVLKLDCFLNHFLESVSTLLWAYSQKPSNGPFLQQYFLLQPTKFILHVLICWSKSSNAVSQNSTLNVCKRTLKVAFGLLLCLWELMQIVLQLPTKSSYCFERPLAELSRITCRPALAKPQWSDSRPFDHKHPTNLSDRSGILWR